MDGSSGPQAPRHPDCCGGAEQVYQIVIEPAAALENRAKKAIDHNAEKAGKDDSGNLADRHKTSSDSGHADAGSAQQSGDGPEEADSSVSAGGDGFEICYQQSFAGESHADLAGRCVACGFSQSGQSEGRPSGARYRHDKRGYAEIGHGLRGGASTCGFSGAELLFTRIADASGNKSNGKDDEQRQKHAQIADSHDERDGRSGKRSAEIYASGKPGEHGESGGDCESGQKSAAAKREFSVMKRCEDSQNHGGKDERQQIRDTE